LEATTEPYSPAHRRRRTDETLCRKTDRSKEPVGLFWQPNADGDFFWAIDEAVDPGQCEYAVINSPAAILWTSPEDWQMGVDLSIDDPKLEINHLAGASFSELLWSKLFSNELKWQPVNAGIIKAGWEAVGARFDDAPAAGEAAE
jgi:hypothetical protein